MKKTFYYKFFPTKAEEDEAAKASNNPNPPLQISRVLVEIRDLHQKPQIDPTNPWQIKKTLTGGEVMTGKLLLSPNDTFEYVFRYWILDMANHVIMGNKVPVAIWDLSDEKKPMRYCSDNIFFEKGSGDAYVLGWMDLVRDRHYNPGDDIGLNWEMRSASFQVKLLRRGS